jgi:hypothetical protein
MADAVRQLLEGIAVALAEDVSPHVEDRFAQMQCKAAAELLGNLAGELEWSQAPIERRNAELREMLEALVAGGWSARPPTAEGTSPAQVRDALLEELGEGLRWLAEHPRVDARPIDALLRKDLERQVASLRRGMFH